jgi:hypothetical protein
MEKEKDLRDESFRKPFPPRDKDPHHIDVVREERSLEQKDGPLDTPDTDRKPEGQGTRN